MPDRRRRVLRRARALVAVGVLAAAAGCTSDDGGPTPIGAAGYTAVIEAFLPPTLDDGSRAVLYVSRLGDEPFSLDDQVTMIAAVEETHDLRFVDDLGAAVDDGDTDAPPRDDGLVVGIGTISPTPPHVVRVEVYRAVGEVEAHKVTLSERGDVWQVDMTESVEPEVLVGDE